VVAGRARAPGDGAPSAGRVSAGNRTPTVSKSRTGTELPAVAGDEADILFWFGQVWERQDCHGEMPCANGTKSVRTDEVKDALVDLVLTGGPQSPGPRAPSPLPDRTRNTMNLNAWSGCLGTGHGTCEVEDLVRRRWLAVLYVLASGATHAKSDVMKEGEKRSRVIGAVARVDAVWWCCAVAVRTGEKHGTGWILS